MTDLQIDIFGNAIPTDQVDSKNPKETIKSRFRRMYGYDDKHRCGECRYLCRYTVNDGTYFKCNLMGISASEATDIRLKDPACSRWEETENNAE